MFFILSKVLFFLIQPINWVIGLMAYSLFAKNAARKRRSLVLALTLAFLLCNRFLFNQVVSVWETDTLTADQIQSPYDIGILLGGYSNDNIRPHHDRHNVNLRGNRFLNAYELYRTGKIKKILLTGGSGEIFETGRREAGLVRDFLLRLGVPDSSIIVENESRNTWENATFTKKILDERYPSATCLLITSAWHMPRSMGCFKKAGVQFTPYSVDFMTEVNRWSPENTLIPDRNGFAYWEFIIKEWVGYGVYWVKGYL